MDSIDEHISYPADHDSDVDDDIVQLACRMANDMLQEGDDDFITTDAHIEPMTTSGLGVRNPNVLPEAHDDYIDSTAVCPDHNPDKPWGPYGSPQSTLKGFSFDREESPPPVSGVDGEEDCPSTVYDGVASKFSYMQLSDEEPTRRRGDINGGFRCRQLILNNDDRFKKEENRHMAEQQGRVISVEKQRSNSSRVPGGGSGRRYGVRLPIRRQPEWEDGGDVMTAFFLTRPGSKAGSTFGTGVFLPPPAGGSIESRKKRGCSTALIPARVLQALKLSRQHLGLLSPSQTTAPHQHYDHATVGGRSGSFSMPEMANSGERPMPEISHQDHEIGLPPEWTY